MQVHDAPPTASPAVAPTVVLVVGAGGEDAFESGFGLWADRLAAAAGSGGAQLARVGPGAGASDEKTDRDRLKAVLEQVEPASPAPLWLVYFGHGTFDGERAKLNLRGPDVAAAELAQWLDPLRRTTAVVLCASSSGAFLPKLARPGRIVVSATKSGHQYSYSRFGDYFSAAWDGLDADLDKDEQVSLHEAFLHASAGTAEFYVGEARLATEHALLDDNGDGLGTPASWFRGVRSTREPEPGKMADGPLAHQLHLVPSARERALSPELRRERDQLELELEALRQLKPTLEEDAYYARLEAVLLKLALLYRQD
ncbi:MAG: hypothetical protein GY711_04060 [bacterium]|nr:hypothetical protein [bacterium]